MLRDDRIKNDNNDIMSEEYWTLLFCVYVC